MSRKKVHGRPNIEIPKHGFNDNVGQKALSEMWPYFVGDWDKRWGKREDGEFVDDKVLEGKFLEENVIVPIIENSREKIRCMDLAAGIGLEATRLAQEYPDFSIYANELDDHLRSILEQNLADNKVKRRVNVQKRMWEDMCFDFNKRFDFLLNLGNAFPYINGEAEQLKVLNQFRNLLKENESSRLVIDLRNWGPLARRASALLNKDRLPDASNFSAFSGGPMYNGDGVHGYPVAIDRNTNSLLFRYGFTDEEKAREYGDSYLRMTKININQMIQLLYSARLYTKQIFGDFVPMVPKEHDRGMGTEWIRPDGVKPQFIQFVAGIMRD
ncbi:hypothetical protein JW758_05145 [Candidatus Peregrinibacteria bacterium]|nr:hypothetical protein [Candidatus Peregrinibacteria bacterium]